MSVARIDEQFSNSEFNGVINNFYDVSGHVYILSVHILVLSQNKHQLWLPFTVKKDYSLATGKKKARSGAQRCCREGETALNLMQTAGETQLRLL